MFKRKKKKTGVQTPEFRSKVPMPKVKSPRLPNDCNTVTCLIRRGTTTEWKTIDPIIYLNELTVEYSGDTIVGYKLGDGIKPWSELEYLTNINDIKEFWLYCAYSNGKRYLSAKIMIDPFTINDFLKENN